MRIMCSIFIIVMGSFYLQQHYMINNIRNIIENSILISIKKVIEKKYD
jgi:hypothetical protein